MLHSDSLGQQILQILLRQKVSVLERLDVHTSEFEVLVDNALVIDRKSLKGRRNGCGC